MKPIFFLILSILFILSAESRADLQVVKIDASNPIDEFKKAFKIRIEKNQHLTECCNITISYVTRPDKKGIPVDDVIPWLITYDHSVLNSAYLKLQKNVNDVTLQVPLQFTQGNDGRTSVTIIVKKSLPVDLKVILSIFVMRDGFHYEIDFSKVK